MGVGEQGEEVWGATESLYLELLLYTKLMLEVVSSSPLLLP